MKEMTAVQPRVMQVLRIRSRIFRRVRKRDGNAVEKVPVLVYAFQVADLHV